MSRFYDLLKTAGGTDLLGSAMEAPSPSPALPDIELPLLEDPTPVDVRAAAPTVAGIGSMAGLPHENDFLMEALTGRVEENRAKPISLVFPPNTPALSNAANGAILEHYRRLRTKILHMREARTFRTLVVTSPEPQDGKTVTTLNLALSFAMVPSFRIAVVDADLRRGSLSAAMGADEHQPGFSNLIEGSASLHDVIYHAEERGLYFVSRGDSKQSPSELLQSSRLAGACRRIGEEFDLVLMDSAPVNIVADTHLLVTHCDAVLLVARAFATTKKSLEKAVQELHHGRIIGTVLNGATRPRTYRGYKSYANYY
jgi:capsular exopolysaccharide synthesis family protein